MSRILLCCASVLAVAVATPASAVIMTATYTGTVESGRDLSGIFGTPSTDMAGLSFTAAFAFDTTLGTRTVHPTLIRVRGGTGFATSSPAISAILTISGVSVPIDGSEYADVYVENLAIRKTYGNHLIRRIDEADFSDYTEIGIYAQNLLSNIPFSLETSFVYQASQGDASDGSFTSRRDRYFIDSDGNEAAETVRDTYLRFNIARLVVAEASVGGIPEPASWAMMIAGFGLVGAVARRRRVMAIA